MEAILVNHGGKHLIRPQGPMSAADAKELGDTIDSLLAEGGYCFTLDLRNVPRLDDLGAGAIQTVAARLPPTGRLLSDRERAGISQRRHQERIGEIVLFRQQAQPGDSSACSWCCI